jgi:hypothetical protein
VSENLRKFNVFKSTFHIVHETIFRKTLLMITRLIPLLLLGSSFLVPLRAASAAPTIQLVVPIYDYPRSMGTIGRGISNDGKIAGQYVFHGKEYGFYRLPNGQFSASLSVPDSLETDAHGINIAGVVCGTFIDLATTTDHGFFFDGTTYTPYDVPGAQYTDVNGENDAGDFTGFYYDGSAYVGFTNIGGVLTTFEALGSNVTFPQAINNLGQVVGYVGDLFFTGFFRDTDGTVTTIAYPGAASTFVYGLNDQGFMVGGWQDAGGDVHGFLRNPTNHFISYDYPDEQYRFTAFGGINNSKVISGWIQDPATSGALHGFVARPGH